jgi:TPR repeat protein
MQRAIAFAMSLSAFGLVAAPAAAQDQPAARLTSRPFSPPLSVRALPAAPPVHKLSIGPLSAPAEDAMIATPRDTAAPKSSAGDAPQDTLVRRANAGDAEANYLLCLKYLAGEGVVRDFVEAFARLRLAAEAGHPRAISLFYAIGARLTAEEHRKAYLRAQELRPAARPRAATIPSNE